MCAKITASPETEIRFFCKQGITDMYGQSAIAKLEAGLALLSKQDTTSPEEEPWISPSVNLF